jgi:alpha-ketoglutarate-dependent taurine dioxygenase
LPLAIGKSNHPEPAFPLSLISLPVDGRPYVLVEAQEGEALAAIDRNEVHELFKEHGAILLRGFASSLEDFGAFAQHFCPVAVQNDSRNRLPLDRETNVQSVNLGVRSFPLHPELSREPWKPDACFFYCVEPPSQAGQTTVCDGIEIVRGLPAEIRDDMAGRRLKYVLATGPEALRYWLGTDKPTEDQMVEPPEHCPFSFERHGGVVMRCFTRPLLHRARFQNELAFGNFLLFARYLRGVKTFPLLDDMSPVPDHWVAAVKEVSDRLTAAVDWRPMDLLMLDNSRFMHGRREVVPNDRRLIATYFGYLRDADPDPEEPADPPWRKSDFVPPTIVQGPGDQ